MKMSIELGWNCDSCGHFVERQYGGGPPAGWVAENRCPDCADMDRAAIEQLLTDLNWKYSRPWINEFGAVWAHDQHGEVLVPSDRAGDFKARRAELFRELAKYHGCPGETELRMDWFRRMFMDGE